MIPMGNYYGLNSTSGMGFPSNLNVMNMSLGAYRAGNSTSSFRRDSEAHLAVEWSSDEQYKLEEGLVRYANEPSMMRYIKIAATLSDKTVRDVTMRCRWMTPNLGQRKRRKPEDINPGKKLRKDKVLVRSNSRLNTFSPPQQQPPPGPPPAPPAPVNMMASYPNPIMNNYQNQNQLIMPCGPFDGTKYLLEQNNQLLGQISSNLSTFEQLQDNADLFSRSRNNINDIQNRCSMSTTPGIMSQLPPLPVSVNEELADDIIVYSNIPEFEPQFETSEFGLISGMDLKHEPWMLMGDC
jgi:hypothetical protein